MKLETLCKIIGCSGIDPINCPGDPNCEIIRKILKDKQDKSIGEQIQIEGVTSFF